MAPFTQATIQLLLHLLIKIKKKQSITNKPTSPINDSVIMINNSENSATRQHDDHHCFVITINLLSKFKEDIQKYLINLNDKQHHITSHDRSHPSSLKGSP